MRSRAWRCGLAVAALAVALGTRVEAQTPAALVERAGETGVDVRLLVELRERSSEVGLEPGAASALLLPAVELAERGLPHGMVARKALEGLAKGVPADRIAGVLEGLRTDVGRAGRVVDPWLRAAPELGRGARSTLIESTALGLSRGGSEEAVRELLTRIPAVIERRVIGAVELGAGIEVLPQLPVAERDPALAAQLVAEALASGFEAGQLRELPEAMRAAERRGELPAEAVARGALAHFRGDLPAATILQNLFQGDFPGNVPFDLPPGLENATRGPGRGPPPPPPFR